MVSGHNKAVQSPSPIRMKHQAQTGILWDRDAPWDGNLSAFGVIHHVDLVECKEY